MTKDEALKLALNALENTDRSKLFELERNAIATIKEILAQPNSEYVAFMDVPFKPWVSLTDDEIKAIVGPWGSTEIKGYTRTLFDQIETALKEKNT